MSLSPIDATIFRSTCSKFATGIAVATVRGSDGRPHGLTVNSFTSVSLAPPLVLVCVDYRAAALPHFRTSRYYAINVLREDQREVSAAFAQKKEDRFESLKWSDGADAVPILDGALACFECRVSQTVEAGDHAIFIGEVVRARCHEGRPLLYFNSGYARLAQQ